MLFACEVQVQTTVLSIYEVKKGHEERAKYKAIISPYIVIDACYRKHDKFVALKRSFMFPLCCLCTNVAATAVHIQFTQCFNTVPQLIHK